MSGHYYIGVDIGTSSTKTGLWHADGRLIAEASAAYKLSRPQPTWAEIDARAWWKATQETIRTVLAESGIDPADVAGVGVDGLGWALVPVDRQGEPLYPAMIWLDRRAEPEAAELRSLPQADALVTLDANPLDAAYITPKLKWLQKHEPEIFEQTYQFLNCSGYINQQLTGQFTCDYTQAYGYHFFDIAREMWDEQAAQWLGLPLGKMPPLYQSCDVIGEIIGSAASLTGLKQGTPVIAGALDAAAGAFGSGVGRIGQTADQGGTAFGFSMCLDQVVVEPRLIFSHHVVPGTYILQGGTVGGAMLGWFRDTLGHAEAAAAAILNGNPFALMSQQAETSPPGANGLVFLPYMSGERSPLWNSNARGVFFGMSYNTNRADILRAIMEGCAFAVWRLNRAAMSVSGSASVAPPTAPSGARSRPISPTAHSSCRGVLMVKRVITRWG